MTEVDRAVVDKQAAKLLEAAKVLDLLGEPDLADKLRAKRQSLLLLVPGGGG